MRTTNVYCIKCANNIDAYLTDGEEIYPHREDLYSKKFWKCPHCKNYIGCHEDSENTPLGVIPTPELRVLRKRIHALLDPWWKLGKIKRSHLYWYMTYDFLCNRSIDRVRSEYKTGFHVGNIKSEHEAQLIINYLELLSDEKIGEINRKIE